MLEVDAIIIYYMKSEKSISFPEHCIYGYTNKTKIREKFCAHHLNSGPYYCKLVFTLKL